MTSWKEKKVVVFLSLDEHDENRDDTNPALEDETPFGPHVI